MNATTAAAQVATCKPADFESLARGSRDRPNGNDDPVVLHFVARGIPAADVVTFGPDQNVRTYRAWRALGRQVRKDEQCVHYTVWVTVPGKDRTDRRYPKTACVFHVSQTDKIGGIA